MVFSVFMVPSKAATIGTHRKSGGDKDGIWDVVQAAMKMIVPVLGPHGIMLRKVFQASKLF